MTKDRTIDELTAIWNTLDDDQRHDFIENHTTVREIYRLDQAQLLNWTPVLED